MLKPIFSLLVLLLIEGVCLFSPCASAAQLIGSINSEHVNVRMPAEREALGRDAIADLERCYGFMNRATGASLPKKILIQISWDTPEISCSYLHGSIQLGMRRAGSAEAMRTFLLHHAAREIARMGLLVLSQGAEREDTEFLFEGMVKLLVHEYEHSSRNLESAWAISKLLDQMQMLGLKVQRSWTEFSAGKRCLRSAAPGITFLTTFRELYGRDRPLKLFESLKKAGLNQSLVTAFKAPVSDLEETWLKSVREHEIADEITVSAGKAPELLQTELFPGAVQPGGALKLRLLFRDSAGNLLPEGVFVKDERSGRLMQAQAASEKEADYMVAVIPIEPNCAPGQYNYKVTVIDESGNLRNFTGTYKVTAP